MRIALRLVLFATLIGSVIWAIKRPAYDSYIAVGVALSAVIAEFATKKSNRGSVTMTQHVEEQGKGIQAGGNITINK